MIEQHASNRGHFRMRRGKGSFLPTKSDEGEPSGGSKNQAQGQMPDLYAQEKQRVIGWWIRGTCPCSTYAPKLASEFLANMTWIGSNVGQSLMGEAGGCAVSVLCARSHWYQTGHKVKISGLQTYQVNLFDNLEASIAA
jgi:hypothetical protein